MEHIKHIEPGPKVLATKEMMGNFYIVTERGVFRIDPARNTLVQLTVDFPKLTVAAKIEE